MVISNILLIFATCYEPVAQTFWMLILLQNHHLE